LINSTSTVAKFCIGGWQIKISLTSCLCRSCISNRCRSRYAN